MAISSASEFSDRFFGQNPALRPLIAVMETVPSACLFVKDLESRYVHVNPAHLTTYDLHRTEDLVGKGARHFFPALLAEAYESEDRRVMESGKPIFNQIWLVPHVRGTPRWFVSSKSPLFDLREKVIGLVGLMRPIATPEDQRTHFQELQRVVEYIDDHFVSEITIENLASIAGLSVPHFNRRFRQLLRISPMQYVLSLRIQEAQRMLATSDESIGDIALATGFYDQSHFTRRFRTDVGMTPLSYRRNYRA